MKLIFLFPLLAIVSAKTKIHPNAVNLALETSLIFDGENTKKDLTFIDGLTNFLNKLKTYLKLREQTSFRTERTKDEIFTEFFKDFSRIVINYDNESLKNLTDILALVMEPYYYKGTTFHKIIDDEKLKTYIKDKIMDWADTDPKVLKYQMATAVMSKENTPWTEFGSYLNKFFSEKDSKKLKKLLKKFNKHENPTEMHKLVKKSLGFLIFHRYNKLNETAKNDLSNALKNVRDFLINEHDTLKLSSPKRDYPAQRNKTIKVKNRRSEVKINSLLPKTIVLNKNVEFNVQTQGKDEKIQTGLVKDIVTQNKISKKPVIKVRKWEKVPYISMEFKLNDDKHITIKTKDHQLDTIINNKKYSDTKEEIKEEVKINTTLELSATEATTETSPSKDNIKFTTIESKDSTHVDLYKQIMSINIGGENETESIDTGADDKKDTENKNDDTRQPETMALVQNSDDKATITKDFEAQDEILNTTASYKDETTDSDRRMGLSVQRSLPYVDVTELDTHSLSTEELKMKIDMNPHETATKVIGESNSKENEETATKRHDDIVDSDKEEYQTKIEDGAKKISNLLDNAIAMKLLGIT